MGENNGNSSRKYLLVGLGGSGGKVISKLYERLIAERGEGFKSNVTCVAIDTDQDELNQLAQLGVKKVQISGSGTVGQMVNTLGQDVNDWCPTTQNEGNFYSSHVFNGASQCRLKSRLCFASFLKNANNELENVLEEFLRITSSGSSVQDAPPIVYIVSSIAGGTGSGIFIQTAFYIKRYFQDKNLQPIVYGLFACPDLYKDVVTPQQVPNLYANAYAVIRELNAFNMICGDDMEAPWGGKVTLDIELSTKSEGRLFEKNAKGRYGDKPYDVLYFIDRVNYLSSILGGLDKYYDAMGDIAFSHLYSDISGEVLSTESNEMNAHSIAPCAIYASAGAATLCYPYKDVVRYIGDRAIYESFDSTWKDLDTKWKSYLMTKDADARASGLTRYIPEPGERGKHFCDDFKAAVNKDNMQQTKLAFMGRMTERSGMAADAYLMDKILAEAESRIREDDRFEQKKQALGLADTAQAKSDILAIIRGEAAAADSGADGEKADQFHRIRQIDEVLDDYCEAGLRFAFDDAIELANRILCLDPSLYPVYEEQSQCGVVNLLLRNPENEGQWVHPVAARQMLYQFRVRLQSKLESLLGDGENTPENDLVDFRNKLVRSHVSTHLRKLADNDENSEISANADVLQELISRWFGKRDTQRGVEEYFRSLGATLENIEQGFVDAVMFFALLRVESRLEALIREYEVFFDNIDEFVKKADAAQKRGQTLHERSSEAVYVCADAQTKDALYKKASANIDLQTGKTAGQIAASLFSAMRDKAGKESKKRNFKEDLRNTTAFFDTVSDMVADGILENPEIQPAVQMNVVQAMLSEYALKNPENASDVENYSQDTAAATRIDLFLSAKLKALSVMAAPLLQFNVKDIYHAMFRGKNKDGEEIQKREVTNTYRYLAHSKECRETIENMVGRQIQEYYAQLAAPLPKDSANQTISTSYVQSDSADDYSILCYSTVHCLQPYQIRAFDEVNHGVFYEHYAKRVAEMELLQKYSMTPHMDKRWHKHGAMPYINVAKEKERRYDLAKAFLYALCYGKIGFVEKGSDTKLVFNDINLGRSQETIYYNGKIIPKNKTNRAMYWFANQEELIELYASLFDKAVEAEVEKLTKYSDSADSYKRGITNYARILNQMRNNVFRDMEQSKKRKKQDESEKAKEAKKQDKKRYSILRFAWELRQAEENELDKDFAELLVQTLCLTIKKYAKAPYNQEAVENRDQSSVAYKAYLEVGKHVAETFLTDYGTYISKELNLREETEEEKKERLRKNSFGRNTDDLTDEDEDLGGATGAAEIALSKTPNYEWAKNLIGDAFAE